MGEAGRCDERQEFRRHGQDHGNRRREFAVSPDIVLKRINKSLNILFKTKSSAPNIRSTPNPGPHPMESRVMSATLRSVEGQDEASILREIQSALQGLRFGSVEITVHNAQVVQIERKEKFRLQNQPAKG